MNQRRQDEEVSALKRRVRRLTERNKAQFDLGFAAAIRLMEEGASLERIKEAQCIPSALPEEDTLPFDEPDTDVHPIQDFT